jgi:hypothetical protein
MAAHSLLPYRGRRSSREWARGTGFCRSLSLDSTEAERLTGESRPPFPLDYFLP